MSRPFKLTQADVVCVWHEGMSAVALARSLGVSRPCAMNAMRRYGLPTLRQGRPKGRTEPTRHVALMVAEVVVKGLPKSVVAQRWGVSHQNVSALVAKWGDWVQSGRPA